MRLDTSALPRSSGATRLLVAGYLAFLLVSAITPDVSPSTPTGAVTGLALAWAFFALSITTAIAVIRTRKYHERPLTFPFAVVALAAAIPLRLLAAHITGPAAPSAGSLTVHFPLLIILTGLIGSWVVAPLAEEWVFRGYLLPKEPTWRDIAFNALLFALLHPWHFAQPELTLRSHAAVFALGLALAATKKLTRSTWTCVALHFFINIAGLLTLQVTTEAL